MKIYVKLSLLVSFLVIASSAALFFLTDNQVETAIRQEILSNLTRQSEQSVENIERFIFSRLNDVKMAATNPYFKNTNTDQEELIARLQELENLNDLYYSFSYFNMDRVRLADSKRQAIGKQHSNSSFWTLVGQDNEAVLDITEDEASNLVMMHFATIVRNGSENVGVLVGSIRVDELYKLMGDFSLSSEGGRRMEVNWVDSQGTLLYSNTNPDDILKSKYEKFDQIKDLNRTGVNFTETDEELIFVTKDSGYLNYEGSNWKLILSITKEQAFSPLSDVRSRFVFAALGALILSLIIAIVVANIFVKPIVRLSKAAEQLGEGKLDTDLTQSFSSDEIGTLAKNLSATTQTLLNKIEEEKNITDRYKKEIKEVESQKGDIEYIHKEVQESINYSQRIQRSMLPDPAILKRIFKDKLLLYRPKDIVSGDFYWFERVRSGRHEHMILVAADCTGHGVPGAIMSMIGSNQLTNIIYFQNYLDPEKILARLDKAIKFELYRDMAEDEPRHDGMEIGICVIDLDTMELTFAGAGIPLYFTRAGQTETYKSPKVTIGRMEGTEKEAEEQFTPLNIQLESGDRFFMASDGFQDQFGGPNDKRFMAKNFRNLLMVSGQDKSMSELEEKINEVFDHWKGSGDQTDDVLVLGVEI